MSEISEFNELIPWHIKEKLENEFERIYKNKFSNVHENLYIIMKDLWVNGYYQSLEDLYINKKEEQKL